MEERKLGLQERKIARKREMCFKKEDRRRKEGGIERRKEARKGVA